MTLIEIIMGALRGHSALVSSASKSSRKLTLGREIKWQQRYQSQGRWTMADSPALTDVRDLLRRVELYQKAVNDLWVAQNPEDAAELVPEAYVLTEQDALEPLTLELAEMILAAKGGDDGR